MLLPEGIQFTRDLQRLAASIGFTRKNLASIFYPLVETTTLNDKGKTVFVWCGVRRKKKYWGMGHERQLAFNDLMERWVSENSFKAHPKEEIAAALNVSTRYVGKVLTKVTVRLRGYAEKEQITELLRSYYKK